MLVVSESEAIAENDVVVAVTVDEVPVDPVESEKEAAVEIAVEIVVAIVVAIVAEQEAEVGAESLLEIQERR